MSTLGGVSEKVVAIVGRAETLEASGQGAAIDAAEVVVRINWTLPIAEELHEHVGERTDLLYHCAKICEGPRIAARLLKVPVHRLDTTYRRALVRRLGLDPTEYQPNTGTVAVFHALDSGAREVRAYGMDFFRSGHIGEEIVGPRGKTWTWSHDPERDRELLASLWRAGRLTPDPQMRLALERAA